MIKTAVDITLDPATEGMISDSVLSHYSAPKGALSFLENLHNDVIGVLVSRRPFVARNTPAAVVSSCVLYQTPSSSQVVVWQESTTMKYATVTGGGAITSFLTSSSANRNRYDIIQGKIIMTNDNVGQPKLFDTTGAPAVLGTSFPGAASNFDIISAGFSGRIWGAGSGDTTCKLYYSDVIPAAGVSSATGGTNYLTINANNGDHITALARTQQCLVVYTNNGVFRVYNTQSQDTTPISNVGAFSQEGVVKAKDGFYFYHPSGVYYMDPGGAPKEISLKIRDMIQRVPSSYQTSVFGWGDDDHVYFCLGNKLQGLEADKTYYIRYTISTQVWTTYSSYQFLPTCADNAFFASGVGITEDIYPTNYIFGSNTNSSGVAQSTYFSGTLNVFTPSTENSGVVTDWATYPVSVDMQTEWETFDAETHLKQLTGLALPTENAAGLKIAYQIDKDPPNEWRPVGQVSADYVTLFKDFKFVPCNRIKIRVYGDTKGTSVRIAMPTFLKVEDVGYKTNESR